MVCEPTLGATNTSIAITASGTTPKPTQGLTLPNFVLVLSTRYPITSSHTAPTIPATRNTVEMAFDITPLSNPLPLKAKSAKKVAV